MVVVIKKRGDSKDNLFRKFTKTFIEEDIVNEVRRKLFYKKPSLVKKEEAKEKLKRRHNKLYDKS
jgi:ribosomal protein S21